MFTPSPKNKSNCNFAKGQLSADLMFIDKLLELPQALNKETFA